MATLNEDKKKLKAKVGLVTPTGTKKSVNEPGYTKAGLPQSSFKSPDLSRSVTTHMINDIAGESPNRNVKVTDNLSGIRFEGSAADAKTFDFSRPMAKPTKRIIQGVRVPTSEQPTKNPNPTMPAWITKETHPNMGWQERLALNQELAKNYRQAHDDATSLSNVGTEVKGRLAREKLAQDSANKRQGLQLAHSSQEAETERAFKSGEAETERTFKAGESILDRKARLKEAEAGREFVAGESEKTRDFTAEQNKLNRESKDYDQWEWINPKYEDFPVLGEDGKPTYDKTMKPITEKRLIQRGGRFNKRKNVFEYDYGSMTPDERVDMYLKGSKRERDAMLPFLSEDERAVVKARASQGLQ